MFSDDELQFIIIIIIMHELLNPGSEGEDESDK
jgi:hypothetical protein